MCNTAPNDVGATGALSLLIEPPSRTMNRTNPNFTETEKALDFSGETLHGSLCMPTESTPRQLVLMIPGSGEVDRNENAMQLQLNTFNAIAHHLAQAGIASFRFDKRGCAMSGGNYYETGFFNFVDDAEAWLNALHTFPEVSETQLFILGHSEGTLISAFISSSNALVQGQILLTPFLENLEITIERQLQKTLEEVGKLTGFKGVVVRLFLRLSGNQLTKQRKIMKRVKNTTKSTIKLKKTQLNAKWLREISSVEPIQVYEKVSVPTLSIGGQKDLQCLPSDAEKVAEYVKGPVETHVLENLTHILRVDEDTPSTFKYKQLSADPIDPRIGDIVIRWLQEQVPATSVS